MTTHLQGAKIRVRAMKAAISFFALLALWPVSTGSIRFFEITTPLSVSAEKNHPPYIAFAETQRSKVRDEWDAADRQPSTSLSTELPAPQVAQATILRLEPMRISKPLPEANVSVAGLVNPALIPLAGETIAASASAPVEKAPPPTDWIDTLPKVQRARLIAAQAKSDVLNEDWSAPDWKTEAEQVVKQATAKIDQEDKAKPQPVIIAAGTNPDGSLIPAPERSVARVAFDPKAGDDSTEVFGDFEIGDGATFLGQTYDHHFEVSRTHEGVEVEHGAVNVADGAYSIRVRGRTGRVVARLTDAKGKILGEDSFYLSQVPGTRGRVKGPRLRLTPREDLAGRAVPAYAKNESAKIAEFRAEAFSGAAELATTKTGDFEFNDVQKGSMTVLRVAAKDHATSVALVPAGFREDLALFPLSWVASLKNIVSEQRRMSLDDPESPVIWGRVSQDGKPRAGVTVELESFKGLEAVYFNQLMLPDSNLKATSENGLFAIIGAPLGFQSLIARVGEAYLAHQNAVVEEGSVALANLETTLRTEPSPMRVFDAFVGEPRTASILHQGIEKEVIVDESGLATVSLPVLHRMSLVMVKPEAPYAPATYLANDDQGYVHLPLVRDDWIRALQVYWKVDDVPGSSVVVGFVADEDFSAEALDPNGFSKVVYFDSHGNPVPENKHGVAGGGFVIYGLSEGVREVVVSLDRSGQIASRVVPSDSRALVVLGFRSE